MPDPRHHLAQANIARALAPLESTVMRGFVDQLDYINSVADRAPGFVWRLQRESGDATALSPFDDPLVIVNMSVWESIEDLYRYVFESDHLGPLKARRSWFEKVGRPHSVLWWVPAGHRPDLEEMVGRLDLLRDLGPGPEAFTFGTPFGPDGRPLPRAKVSGRECGV